MVQSSHTISAKSSYFRLPGSQLYCARNIKQVTHNIQFLDMIAAQLVVSGIGAIAVTAIAGILVHKYRLSQKAQVDDKKWYQDAVGLVARVQQAGYRTTTYQHQVDHPEFHEKLEPLAEEIQEHAGSVPNRVDEEARIELIYSAAFCSGLLNFLEMLYKIQRLSSAISSSRGVLY